MDKTLLIMAAGMGSRFGGLKQLEAVGRDGEFIIDYSIYDAIEAGFNKIVIIIKEENYEAFRETIGKRIEDKVKVEYAFQKNDNLPEGYNITRDKPLGTGHALLCAKDKINEPFAIISADDFYGRESFVKLTEFLDSHDFNKPEYSVIGYLIRNTMSEVGSVKRGICEAENGYLVKLGDSVITEENGVIHAEPLNGDKPYIINENHLASMLMFSFNPTIFDLFEEKFIDFLEENKDDMSSVEILLPDVLGQCINEGKCTVELVKTGAVWHGITYKEDKEKLSKAIDELIKDGIYPEKLWD